MDTFRNASQEIIEAINARREREAQRRRVVLPIRAVDALIAELEELNLVGRQRVPESFDLRLDALAQAVPERFRAELRSRVAIARLMDHLYAITEYLLALKVGDRGVDGDDEMAPALPAAVPTSHYPRAS